MDKETRLKRIEEGNCPHAILLAGPPESSQEDFAREAASRYLFHSNDISHLASSPFYMEISEYSIETVRNALQLLNAEAFERGRRCILLLNAHKMTQLVQNVLLKTLEEPPADTLLLLTGVESGMLPTILSRCMILRTETEPWETICKKLIQEGTNRETAEHCARRSGGIYGRAKIFATEEELAFRKSAIDAMQKYLKGIRPIPEAAAICTRSEQDETGEGRKKNRVSAELADRFFDIWLELLADALKRHTGWSEPDNSDCKPLVKNLADNFTIRQIQGMMNTLLEGKKQLIYRATASMTLDWVLTKMP